MLAALLRACIDDLSSWLLEPDDRSRIRKVWSWFLHFLLERALLTEDVLSADDNGPDFLHHDLDWLIH